MSTAKPSSSSPQIYDVYHQKFIGDGIPKDAESWQLRARQVAEILAEDAASRDIQNKSPRAEVALLKSSGLLKILGPKSFGGGGQTSIGMLLGYHLLWSTTANLLGTKEQQDRFQKLIIESNYFVGGAVNPRDNELKVTLDGEELVFDGFKNFNTGGVISDLTVLEGIYEGTEAHIYTIVKTDQPGIQFKHNWDNIGLRLTESGSVKIEKVRVPWSDAFGWDATNREVIDSVLKIPFATLLLPTIQHVFSNFYLGIALGALEAAANYTKTNTRAWPFGGDNKDSPTEEFYILERYGNFKAHLLAAEALADRVGADIAQVYETHGERRDISAQARGEVAESVAAVKIVTTETGLRVTSGIFEVLGSRATGRKWGFDRYWRDIRTHTLHDPVAYKNRELGRYALLDEIPEPTWYT
ncbi:MAG: hypothetical protein M1818_000531 [Claussenomyces sp. TS43310]|nr:MAG: hypothetical protein M1818_000531 [Claussenomyces sp. TS43310]